ncbi:hypothetical protein HMI51_20980 [Corallococcus coralloides]|nr:hypothetical protein [Corallococcus coralloides]
MEEFPFPAGNLYPVNWLLNRGASSPPRVTLSRFEEAEQYLGGLGFPVNDKVIPGAQHCAFDQVGRVTEAWNEATAQ